MKECSEIKLAQEIVSGSRSAFDLLFLKYYSRLCAFAATILKRDDLAEEAVSEVFFTLWKSRHTIKIHTSVKSYLFTSVRNQAVELLKKENVEKESYSESEDFRLDDSDPQLLFEYNELTLSVEHAINLLPPKCKRVFILNRFEGMKYRQIAEVCNISEKNVENQLVKALVFLRKTVFSVSDKAFTSR